MIEVFLAVVAVLYKLLNYWSWLDLVPRASDLVQPLLNDQGPPSIRSGHISTKKVIYTFSWGRGVHFFVLMCLPLCRADLDHSVRGGTKSWGVPKMYLHEGKWSYASKLVYQRVTCTTVICIWNWYLFLGTFLIEHIFLTLLILCTLGWYPLWRWIFALGWSHHSWGVVWHQVLTMRMELVSTNFGATLSTNTSLQVSKHHQLRL